jgi:hypothetical protein
MSENKEMMNYFSALCFRIFAQPFTAKAISAFIANFDRLSKDNLFNNTFKYTAADLSEVERLLLFFSVHRNEVTLIMEQEKAARKAAVNTTSSRRQRIK